MLLAAAATFTGAVGALLAWQPKTPLAQTVGNLAITVATILAVTGCVAAARRGGDAARAWWVMVAATAVYCAAQLAFLAEVPDTLTTLRAAVADGAAHRVLELAHRLRGAASNLGANQLATACADLELAAKHDAPADTGAAPGRVEHEMQRAADAFARAMPQRA